MKETIIENDTHARGRERAFRHATRSFLRSWSGASIPRHSAWFSVFNLLSDRDADSRFLLTCSLRNTVLYVCSVVPTTVRCIIYQVYINLSCGRCYQTSVWIL